MFIEEIFEEQVIDHLKDTIDGLSKSEMIDAIDEATERMHAAINNMSDELISSLDNITDEEKDWRM